MVTVTVTAATTTTHFKMNPTESKESVQQQIKSDEQTNNKVFEKFEEEKLKSKYPSGMNPSGGHSSFVQKRLQKGTKFFDSGDYQMARQRSRGGGYKPIFGSTGDAIPTPETVSVRKYYHATIM
ncbi:hypothetical protein ACLKA7_010121 [Drosophila subpalustris]